MERVYTVPLRRAYNAAHKYRARAAMKTLRAFIARHMKVGEAHVKIHESVNHEVWKRGARKPPKRIKVVAVKEGEYVWVYTPEARRGAIEEKVVEEKKKEEKEEKKGEETPKKRTRKRKRAKKEEEKRGSTDSEASK